MRKSCSSIVTLLTAVVILVTAACFGPSSAGVARAAEVVRGAHGMVVAGTAEAAQAGVAVMRQGGNAIDAAVATALTLGVSEPWASGLGGKVMLLYFDAKTHRVYAVEALGQASWSLDSKKFASLPAARRGAGPASAAVPGMLAGWGEAQRRWGKLKWPQDVQPAIDAAAHGVRLDRYDVSAVTAATDKLKQWGGYDMYCPGGRMIAAGQTVRYPELAKTLTLIRDQGPRIMYGGVLGRRIARAVTEAGGTMTAEDFMRYRPTITLAPSVGFRGRRVYSGIPPAVGGSTVLLTLACLDRMPKPDTPMSVLDQRLRVLYEVYPTIRKHIGNGPEALRDLSRLLSSDSVAELAHLASNVSFDPVALSPAGVERPAAEVFAAMPEAERTACTTHFVVADGEGNVVCATQSLSHHFGSGFVVPGTGILMNDSMDNFTTKYANSPNYAAPGRRSRSTISPVIVLGADGKCEMALGSPGGQRIPTAVLQVMQDVYDDGMTAEQAVDDPRVHLRDTYGGDRRQVHLEQGNQPATINDLRRHGWSPTVMDGTVMYFGPVNVIRRADDGGWVGVADDRRTNAARGW